MAEVDFEVILSNAAVYTTMISLLDVQLCELLFVCILLRFRHLIYSVGFLSIARLVPDLSGGAGSFCLKSSLVLVIW